MDGASKDGSIDAIREAVKGHEDRVKFISESDHGMYEASNKRIRIATGDYIGLIYSDDFLYSSHTISDIVKTLEWIRRDNDILRGDKSYCGIIILDVKNNSSTSYIGRRAHAA